MKHGTKNIKSKKIEAQEEPSSMGKIKQSFNQGITEGRRSFLKKLLEIKGTQTTEIQKLYSSGLMEPMILKDITLGDLVKASGVGINFARSIKEILLCKDSGPHFEYEKREVDKIKNETRDILSAVSKIRNEMEQIDKEYYLLQSKLKIDMDERDRLKDELEALRKEERKAYFNEKGIQDETMFFIREQDMFQDEVNDNARQLEASERRLENIKKEFLFTRGECSYIREKIHYLLSKLDSALKMKNVSKNKLILFLDELRCVHDALADVYKKTRVGYYGNR